ncbi:MAG: ABC transporter permease [Ilumatobacteraceae bacterium]|jgi:ABC-2 type transport system permease protein|nr:ABC transporter permease [Acidimicrobiaceae bacterium]MBP6486188.1 ABC transporter permease [Ilumatobacteraceae bacterium]MBK9971826.1 ABC transporter permease [Acidimicrobiaceae bacterium]MBP7887879.1 ABC transporter permease [Ilumatobacteraceae bacterium]MBP8208136.1 ABC transporter permease [Ilumatobacteraceae bacterium]
MINLLHAEWIKLRTVTMNWVLGIIAGAFPLAVTLLTAYFNGDSSEFGTSDLASVLGGTTVVCALLCGVIAAASITSEFGFGTIRPTFAATPQRLRVVVAKGAVVVLATTALATVVQLVGWFAGSAIARGRGATIDLAEVPTAVPAMVGAVVLTALMSLAGYGFGLITRSTPVAVSILIVWPLIAEGLVGGLLGLATDNDDIPRWMPFQAGIRLALVELVDDGPSRLMAGGYFGAVALLLVALGAWAVNRRDA